MLFKRERYYETEVLALAGTNKFELPKVGNLSYIILTFVMQNAAAIESAIRQRIIDHITNISVTDGGTQRLFSLTGQECKALLYMLERGPLPEKPHLFNSTEQRTTVIIPFGRFLRDPQFMLDLSAYPSLYVELTNDLTVAYCAAGGITVDIQLVTAHDMLTKPRQYIKYYERFTERAAAAQQHIYQDIPVTDPLFMMFCQLDPDLAATGAMVNDPTTNAYNVKVTLEDRSFTLWDHRPLDIFRDNACLYGVHQVPIEFYLANGIYQDLLFAENDSKVANEINVTGAIPQPVFPDSNVRFVNGDIVSGVDGTVSSIITGIGYYNALSLYHAFDSDPARFMNPATTGANPKGPIRLDVYADQPDFTLRTCLASPTLQGQT